MKYTAVRYKTKPESAAENTRLIEGVFAQLRPTAPNGVRYLSLRLADGSFVHISATEDGASALTGLAAFRAFQSGISERCLESPQVGEATVVGSHRMLGE